MNAYAPNNASSDNGGYASLTSSLLARKGEALPAVDAVAHEGVDIEMRPLRPANSPGAPKNIGEETIESLYPANPSSKDREARREAGRPPRVRLVHPSSMPQERARPQKDEREEDPGYWTLSGRRRPSAQPLRARTPQSAPPAGILARKAVVTLRMPARDLVRLKFASRDLEMSCQAIILEALECYLEANDAPSASDDDAIMREVERLMAKAKAKRQG